MKGSVRVRRRRRLARMQEKSPKKNRDVMRKNAKKTATRLEPYATSARDTAGRRVVEAREWAAPRLEHAAETVQLTVAPRVSSALNTAAHRLEPTRAEARLRGSAALAALQGKKVVKKKRRWPVAMLFLGLGGAAGAAAGMFVRKPEALEEAKTRIASRTKSAQPPRPAVSPDASGEEMREKERAPVEGQSRS